MPGLENGAAFCNNAAPAPPLFPGAENEAGMLRETPIRPFLSTLPAWVLALALVLTPAGAGADSDQDRWQALMDPASHAHMLGNLADAEDGYQEALALAEKFDRTGGYLERSMAGLAGLYYSQGRFSEATPLYRQALTIAEALYEPSHARYGVAAIYRAALAAAEAGRERQEAAKRKAEEAIAAREGAEARARSLAEHRARAAARVKPAETPAALPATVPPRGVVPRVDTPAADLPPPPTPPSMLSHYRLAGAAIPPPPPAEALPQRIAKPQAPVLPPALEVADAAVPEAAMSTAAAPPETPLMGSPAVPLRGGARTADPALPPAVDVADVTAANVATDVGPSEAAARGAEPEAPPLRGSAPRIAGAAVVPPTEVASTTRPLAAEAEAAETVPDAPPADVRSWEPRALEVAGRPVDAAAVRALAADPTAPPEVAVRASAIESPEELAARLALQERHPVLGIKLPSAQRNTGPLFPNAPRLADTEQAYVAELDALERTLGPRHPEVAAVLYRLARLYQRQSRYELAGRMYERCLAVRERVLPEGHPDIVETLEDYAYLLRASGFGDLAAAMRARAVKERAKAPQGPAK